MRWGHIRSAVPLSSRHLMGHVAMWVGDGSFTQFLDYDVEIRAVICSTNAIERA